MGSSSSKETEVATVWFPEFEGKIAEHIKDKTIAITGCTSGTGLVAAKTSAKNGAKHVLMLNRTSERSKKAEEDVKQVSAEGTIVETIPCDLQDFASVDEAISMLKSKYESLDVLCNNAGVMALEDYATKDGYDVQMQTNHLSHFKLTKELFPLLTKAANDRGEARVVNHSSMARTGGPLKAEYFGKNGGNLGGNGNSMFFNGARWERYHQTKLANSVFTSALKEKLPESSKVKAVCAAPGLSNTNLQKTTDKNGGMGSGMWIMNFSQSPEDGTMPLLTACFDPITESGDFFEPSLRGGMYGPVMKVPLNSNSIDTTQQTLLWEESEKACGTFEL